jgi:exodeoxyribonuclease V alpha subunit
MTMAYGIMLYRNLLYTAITRAKKRVLVFGDPKAFHKAVANLRETVRNSALSELISRKLAPVQKPRQSVRVDMSIPDVL